MTKARDLANIISGGFTADDIPSLDTAKITTGTFADARMPSTVLNSNVDLTNLSATNLTSGTVPIARLGTSGTKDATTFLRGDNTFASAGVTNKPAFKAVVGSSLVVSNDTETKAPFNSETYDTNSAFDSSTNYRFTVPSGEAGKYTFTAWLRFYSSSDNASYTKTAIYKNGTTIDNDAYFQLTNNATDSIRQTAIPYVFTLDLAVGDYIEIYGAIKGGGTLYILGGSTFEGYKLID
jgi:hypothetical protein